MLMVYEGIDASGKALQSMQTAEALKRLGLNVRILDFPNYTSTFGGVCGRILRGETKILAKPDTLDQALILQSAMVLDRLDKINILEEYAGSWNSVLILDRYVLSGIVYGLADDLDLDTLTRVQRVLPSPDCSFLLDIPVEESIRRRPNRRDYYERNSAKLEQVRNLYKDVFTKYAVSEETSVLGLQYHIIDGCKPPQEITKEVVLKVQNYRETGGDQLL